MSEPASVPPGRMVSVDAYRGFVMFLMMAEILHVGRVARAFPDSVFWQTLAFHTSHVAWTGCSLHDLIQPSFSFLVGVALPFSIAGRIARGQTFGWMLAHATWRALLLVALGVFLRSVGRLSTGAIASAAPSSSPFTIRVIAIAAWLPAASPKAHSGWFWSV